MLSGEIELALNPNVELSLFDDTASSGQAMRRLMIPLGSGSFIEWPARSGIVESPVVSLEAAGDWVLASRGGPMVADLPIRVVILDASAPSDFGRSAVANAHSELAIILHAPDVTFDARDGTLMLGSDDVRLSDALALKLGLPDRAGQTIGSIGVRATWSGASVPATAGETNDEPPSTSSSVGPDVIVADLQSINSYTPVDGISAYAIGTTSCNIGNVPVNWWQSTNQHPVIGGSIYRLHNGRFEQLGISWLKHGFLALTGNVCGTCQPPASSQQLGVMCSDPYSATLNGQQAFLGPRWQVNPHTGVFPFPPANPPWSGTIARRIQVRNIDLDPATNAGAVYFGEAMYIAPDDAAAGNGNNNASYRRINFHLNENNVYQGTMTGLTVRQKPAIRAWKDLDPSVRETFLQVPNDGLFIAAAKATQLGNGYWHYEYAVFNQNADRAAQSFTVPLPNNVVLQNIGFHDVHYHSGEPFSPTNWAVTVNANSITWSTDSYIVNPNANALRWGTMYNYRFDANIDPDETTAVLGLFKPGVPNSMNVMTLGPALGIVDCNGNGIEDVTDVAEGTSDDCDGNGVPDECQLDCNANGIADTCDIAAGTSQDCNHNTLPDECEPDCDGDGLIDGCETVFDTDGDGILDCDDECPDTTPQGACLCPIVGECCFDFFGCFPAYPRSNCCTDGGVPDCAPNCDAPGETCYNGCLYGDADLDGDIDLADLRALGECFSGPNDHPSFVIPGVACRTVFSVDGDNDVDLDDFLKVQSRIDGP